MPETPDWTPPERIYLQPSQWPEVSWCDHPVEDDPDGAPDVEYFRADVVEAVLRGVVQGIRPRLYCEICESYDRECGCDPPVEERERWLYYQQAMAELRTEETP